MTPATPRSPLLVLMSLLALVWYVALALDYLAARYDGVATLPMLPEGLGAAPEAMPLWAAVATGVAVWLGLFSAILLLLRDRMAVLCFAFTLIAAAVQGLWLVQFSTAGPQPFMGIAAEQMLGAQLLVPLVLWVYARSLKQRGALG
ncbi:MAG: hypothetical protein JJU42_15765 [Rhodobacteraceae bacterium]|nr:hypothetical protein [Paracoccaceae bacterium]